MKKIYFLLLLLFASAVLYAQPPETYEYDEAGMIEKIQEQASAAGYKQIFRLPSDSSTTFTAETGTAYRLVLIFREHIKTPGRRLVVYQRDSKGHLKTLYMARKDQHIPHLSGHMIVTEVPAVTAGETHIYMTIDALPKEGKLYIFRK